MVDSEHENDPAPLPDEERASTPDESEAGRGTQTDTTGPEPSEAVAVSDIAPDAIADAEAEGGPQVESHADAADADVSDEPGEPAPVDGDVSAAPLESEPAIEDGDEAYRKSAEELKAIVEALIFASPDPLTPKALFKLLDSEPQEEVLAGLELLKQDYQRPGGLQLVEVAGGFQIVTRPDLHEWVRRLFHERSTQKLSVQALETLAVIAYRQPITALEITEIRGVSASGVLNTLLERHLIKIVGRKQVVGRPFMYATTKEFLIRFGLKDLSDLPRVEDMAESLGIESSLLVERNPTEEQLPLSESDAEREAALAADAADADSDDTHRPTDDGEPTIH